MIPLETILFILVWILVGCILAHKWNKVDIHNTIGIWFTSIIFAPLTLIIAIIRHTFWEDWQ